MAQIRVFVTEMSFVPTPSGLETLLLLLCCVQDPRIFTKDGAHPLHGTLLEECGVLPLLTVNQDSISLLHFTTPFLPSMSSSEGPFIFSSILAPCIIKPVSLGFNKRGRIFYLKWLPFSNLLKPPTLEITKILCLTKGNKGKIYKLL